MNRRFIYSVLAASLSLVVGCQQVEQQKNLSKLYTSNNLTLVELLNTTDYKNNQIIDTYNANVIVTPNNELKVNFNSKENSYSAINFTPATPWDWSSFTDFNLALDIANSGEHSVQLYLNITDIDGANYTRTVSVARGEANTYYAKMAGHDLGTPEGDENVELNFNSGLRSNPDTWESDEFQFVSMWGKKNLNVSGIKTITLSVQSALHDKTVTINNIRLRKNPKFNTKYLTHIVDKFGQNAKQDFPLKVKSTADLIKQRYNERKLLDGKLTQGFSTFGGWLDGPKLKATGFFRTEKVNDKWSLVDPEGYLYFATGIDIIRLSNSTTMTGYDFDQNILAKKDPNDVTPEDSQGLNMVKAEAVPTRYVASKTRQQLFTWLPSYDEPLGKHYGYRKSAHSGPLKHGETYSFYSANLERKYGGNNADYLQKWREVTVNRMKSWGFTSLGNWTDPSYYDNNQVPYFANGWIIGDFKTVSSGNDFWAPLPDVFDPVFTERAMVTAKTIAEQIKNNPWCVGIFIDNEKSFGRSESKESLYGIVLHTLQRDGNDVPTKAEFTRLMKSKYKNINKLNQAWDKNIPSWKAFNKGIDSTFNTDEQVKDYSILLTAYADKYFSVVDNALKTHTPNHMYLGARFPDWGKPIEVVKASAKYVDVVSYNIYKEGIHPKSWKFLEEIDMPSIIGEFHIGARDTGLFHPGLIHASDQEDRAKMYKDYMSSVINNPYFIGAHWFQYIDSPITGRAYDGENYNVGFISVTDTPYPPMVKAAKELHSTMYEKRFNH